MKKKKLATLVVAISACVLSGCGETNPSIDENKSNIELDNSSEVAVETINEYDGYYNMNKLIDEHTVEMSLFYNVYIPNADYQVGDSVVANDGRSYEVVSFDDAIANTCDFVDEEQKNYYEEMFEANGISKTIAVSIPESNGDYEYTGYYILAKTLTDDDNLFLFDVTTEGPEEMYYHEYVTDPIVYTVADDAKITILNFVEDESLSMDEQMEYPISVSDFMTGNFPDTAFYHQAEDHYYYKDVDGKDSYSYGNCIIKDGIITEIKEIYQP